MEICTRVDSVAVLDVPAAPGSPMCSCAHTALTGRIEGDPLLNIASRISSATAEAKPVAISRLHFVGRCDPGAGRGEDHRDGRRQLGLDGHAERPGHGDHDGGGDAAEQTADELPDLAHDWSPYLGWVCTCCWMSVSAESALASARVARCRLSSPSFFSAATSAAVCSIRCRVDSALPPFGATCS